MKRADQKLYHYLYKIVRDDSKFYIGMHSTDNLDDGYFGSGQLLWKSIKKYGKERHKKEILEFLPSRIMLKQRERQLVNEELLSNTQCLNLRLGGDGWESADASKAAALGNRSSKRNHNVSCLKATATKRERGTMFIPNPRTFVGKKHSEETKSKMSASQQGKQLGQKNSQYGSCWVTNGIKPIKIKKDQLDEFLGKGFSKGRKVVDGTVDC